jgi:hypothetical protein
VATASFLVDPAHQGQGIGRALGEYVLVWCQSAGFASIQFNAVGPVAAHQDAGTTASRPLRRLISAVFLRGVNMAGSYVRTILLKWSREVLTVGRDRAVAGGSRVVTDC